MKPRAARTGGSAAPDVLSPRAERLWPHCSYLQREWLRAVAVVRGTARGWVLDRAVPREVVREVAP